MQALMQMSDTNEPSAAPATEPGGGKDARRAGEGTQPPGGSPQTVGESPRASGESARRAGESARLERAPDRRHQRSWVPITTGWLCLLVGLSDIIRVTIPSADRIMQSRLHRITPLVPGVLTTVTNTADVIIGLLLLMLSHGLLRRKRRAWQAVTLLLAFSVVIHVLRAPALLPGVHAAYLVPGMAAAAVLVALLYFRDEFYAVGDPRTRWRAAGVFTGLVAADVAIGLTYMLLARGLARDYSLWQRIVHVVYGLVGVSGPVRFVPDVHGDLFNLLTSALGLFTLVVTAYLFLRPAEPVAKLSEDDASQIKNLLARYGDRDSLGYFALRDDKSVIWSPSGKSCICYRVVSGVMLASGDPIGDPEAWPGAIHAFLDEAARHAWVPAVMGCSELGAEVWCREGDLTALELGDEAIVEVADFSLHGRAMRNVRQMTARVCRQGYDAEIRRVADVPREEIDRLIRRADSWRGNPTERGFSMALGRVGGPHDGQCVLATASENGVLRGLLHFVPWGSDGLSLDLMRRDRTSQPGVNDFLIVETIKAAQDLGVKRISLNFAVFRAALARGERIGAGPVLRAWRGILIFMSRWFQIESLYKFNAKFCPQWEPRFFVFPGTRDALRVGFAALEAEAFLVWPRLELRRIARKLRVTGFVARLRSSRRSPGPPEHAAEPIQPAAIAAQAQASAASL
jgi:lysyl-tRNA synthetase, class II